MTKHKEQNTRSCENVGGRPNRHSKGEMFSKTWVGCKLVNFVPLWPLWPKRAEIGKIRNGTPHLKISVPIQGCSGQFQLELSRSVQNRSIIL